MESTINGRFIQLMESLNMNPNSFSKALRKGYTSIDSICKGRTKPSFDLLESLFLTFPQINPDWLISGEGEMFRPLATSNGKVTSEVEPADNYLREHLKQLEDSFNRLSKQLEKKDEQLEKKDEQIAGLQEMLKMQLGKPKRGSSRRFDSLPYGSQKGQQLAAFS